MFLNLPITAGIYNPPPHIVPIASETVVWGSLHFAVVKSFGNGGGFCSDLGSETLELRPRATPTVRL